MEKWEKSFLRHLDGAGTEFSRFLEKLDVIASRKEKSRSAIYDAFLKQITQKMFQSLLVALK